MVILENEFVKLNNDEKLVVALGTFDGLHLGHRAIIESAKQISKRKGIKSAVLTFEKPVFTYFNKNASDYLITPKNIKNELIKSLDIDYLFYVKLEKNFLSLSQERFLLMLKQNINVDTIVCGYNYTFGKNANGNTEYLIKNANYFGLDVVVCDEFTIEGEKVSSSIIRDLLKVGNLNYANKLLGYNYYIKGYVSRGKQLGARLGFATANLIIEPNLCIRNGVYITKTIIDGIEYHSVTNIGINPTFDSKERVLETHILSFTDNLYEKEIKIELLEFIRDEIKFNNIDDLKKRIELDIQFVKKYFVT
ncbi:Riboflavin biosynthesis protein RibF [Caloramator mitchellensis]|uniref:Riboflavin biosynthesis protein n=1 Tax=Caloramator mitchellensis TaxID=908809 RepID=A0A0R3JTW9_CALMK|nr:bifunctional riboflavin kinase/FAD synthetase [Caloramator mitchellensis]KRQ86995.1 Riboflavin biosynthesis protein RibF [Caloramator mitchellensis]